MPRKTKAEKRKAKKKKATKALRTAQHEENRVAKRYALRPAEVLPNRNVDHLDDWLLDDEGRLRILASEVYDRFDPIDLRIWCHLRAVYGLPTTELVEWLAGIIGDKTAIEVGSGNGALGRALDIPRTDSHLQERPDIAINYLLQQQPTVKYGEDVERLDAAEAIEKYNPQIVIGSWVTHWIDPYKPFPEGGGSVYGLHEDKILRRVDAYIVVGNEHIHGHKPILKDPSTPCSMVKAPWIRSRARDPSANCIYIWEPGQWQPSET